MRLPGFSVRTYLFAVVASLGLALSADLTARVWSAWEVVTASKLARWDAVADKSVLDALQALRFERGNSLSALRAGADEARAAGQKLAKPRSELDTAIGAIDRYAAGFADPELVKAAAAVQAEYRAFIALRPAMDEALGKADGRDVTLAARWTVQADRALGILESLSSGLGERVKRLVPETGGLVDIKRGAWRARAAAGSAHAVLAQAVGGRKPLTAAEAETIAADLGKADASWQSVQSNLHRAGVSETIRRNVAAAQASMFSPEIAKFRQSIRDGLISGELSISLTDVQADNNVRLRTILTVATSAMDEVVATTETAVDRAGRQMMAASAVAAAALLVALGGLAVTQFRVIGPLVAMQRTMSSLGRGELDVAVPGLGRRDEIGAMANSVHGFKDSLLRIRALEAETELARASAEEQRRIGMRRMADGFEQAVGGIVGLVSASATQLQATAQRMTAAAAETASQSTLVAAAAGLAADNVNTLAAATEELGCSVQEIGRQVAGSTALAHEAVREADQTGVLVQELNGAVSRIGDVVGLISRIAGQTNLLALNATIEAARAGTAGKGFAVVASEVKTLAEQTTRATGEISSQIAQIQASTGRAVASITAITGRIREIDGVATTIASAVEEQGAATQEIVRNVVQAAQGTGAVTSNIAGVAGAAEQTGTAASEVLGAASELSRQSADLTVQVGRFLASVRAG